jgi:tRNA pseudouridine55 synthase
MGKRRKARFFSDGVLVVNKPEGPTSHDVVARIRGRFGPDKVGHAGTLDPFAAGVLVLLFNRATRLADLMGSGPKEYRADLLLGAATDTGDYTGEVVQEAQVVELDETRIEAAIKALIGERMQSPPAYSAAKHKGKPLYAYARKGQVVEKPPKPITVYDARLLRLNQKTVSFWVSTSRGAYIRSLGEDLARELGTVGHLTGLVREASSPFRMEEAIDLDEALDLGPEELTARMLNASTALARCGLPAVELNQDRAWELRQGRILAREIFLEAGNEIVKGGPFRVMDPKGELVAVLRWLEPQKVRPGRYYETIRVFHGEKSPDKKEIKTA